MNINNIDDIKKNTSNNICSIAYEIINSNYDNINYNISYDKVSEIITIKFIIPSLNFYKEYKSEIKLAKNLNVIKHSCNCQTYKFSKFCEHVMASILIINKDKKDIFNTLNIKEEIIVHPLIDVFKNNKIKEKIHLVIELIKESIRSEKGYYEIKLQIGHNNYYVLKKNINEFFEAYYSKSGSVVFGKNFIYNPKKHYFSDKDKRIIDILPLVLTQKYSFNKDNYNIDNNYLSTYSYKSKMLLDKLRELNKEFNIVIDEVSYEIKSIYDDYLPLIDVVRNDNNISVSIDTSDIIVLTDDFSYIFVNEKVYFLTEEKSIVLKNIIESNNFVFDEKEEKDFNNYVLPKLKILSTNIDFSKNISDKYNIVKPVIKLFFDSIDIGINCVANAYYDNIQVNILDDNTKFNSITIVREIEYENSVKEYLQDLGFIINEQDKTFELLDEDKIIEFLRNKLSDIDEYEIFVTENLKLVKYINKPVIKSSFSLEKGELLKCNISIDGISNDELENIMDSIKYKKKYFKLKNGSYLNLENSNELKELDNMLKSLNIDYKELENKEIKIPKYKALYINAKLGTNDFITTDQAFKNFVNDYRNAINKQITVEQPKNTTLRDYQELGVKWLTTIANTGFGGILADEMGLGKTLQTIMFIKSRLSEDKSREILIVCPTSLIYNWESEFKKYAPSIKVKVIADSRKKREQIFNELKNYEVFITSYGLLREDIDKYKEINYDTFIIDEAQTIKNVNALITVSVKQINASVRLALTGTPIENSILELYSIFDFIMPNFFGSTNNFLKKYNNILKDVNDPIKKDFLHLINPFILRRKKKDVIKELPDKIENNVLVELCEEQRKLYLAEVKKITQDIKDNMRNSNFSKNKLVILQELTRLRQLCISPSLCLEEYNGRNSKIDSLLEIVESAISENHKILIFSQFTSALSIVKKELINKNITYYYLDGSTKSSERLSLVDEFNKNDVPIFLISLKAGGNGLNLIGADIVIHLDPWWNPAVESQATDRAHRIGQKNIVQVIKLIAKGTIEEKIVKLQNLKKELSNEIVEGETRDKLVLKELNEDDLLYLLEND